MFRTISRPISLGAATDYSPGRDTVLAHSTSAVLRRSRKSERFFDITNILFSALPAILSVERNLNHVVCQIDFSKLDFELFHNFRLSPFEKSPVYRETSNIKADRKSYEEILTNTSDYRKYAQDVSIITLPTKMVFESRHLKDALTPSLSSLKCISQCLISNHFAMNPWKRQNRPCSRSRHITSFLYESKYEQNKYTYIT
jgi:hypothetical protein